MLKEWREREDTQAWRIKGSLRSGRQQCSHPEAAQSLGDLEKDGIEQGAGCHASRRSRRSLLNMGYWLARRAEAE